MSAGAFVSSFYKMDGTAGTVNIRVQPETIAASWNTPPAGPVTLGVSASAGGSRRKNGINARRVYGRWTAPPSGYLSAGRVVVPILDPAKYATINKGNALEYAGGTFVVTGKSGEALV